VCSFVGNNKETIFLTKNKIIKRQIIIYFVGGVNRPFFIPTKKMTNFFRGKRDHFIYPNIFMIMKNTPKDTYPFKKIANN